MTVRQRARIGSRWRRKRDGLVIRIYQVHAKDRKVEARVYTEAGQVEARFPVSFTELKHEYELLVSLEAER